MPTPPLMQLPKSQSEKEFEHLFKDILENKYNNKFYLYGRKGQKQNGIDIYSKNNDGNYIVAQCKNYLTTPSNHLIKQIIKDIKATKNLDFNITRFIVMTSMNKDKYVQYKMLLLI